MAALDDIRRACDRLRRVPESRWARPPLLPAGSRPPLAPVPTSGPTLEESVRAACDRLMAVDARARSVPAFHSQVSVFSLADVLEALAKSVHRNGNAAAGRMLDEVAAEARKW